LSDTLAALERLVRSIFGDSKYYRQWPCTVQGQDGDGPLDLLPDDAEIAGPGGLQGVPIRHGLPGITVEVEVGARVLLGFEAGDPQRPYAALWESATIKTIRFDGGDAPIAREGDSVTVYFPPACAFEGTIPAGALLGVMTIESEGVGIITSGADGVLA
jgi:hypothetical protein